jgi:hypothetical protein
MVDPKILSEVEAIANVLARTAAERDRLLDIIDRARDDLLAAKLSPIEAAELSHDLERGGDATRSAHRTMEALATIIRAIGILAEVDPADPEGEGVGGG